MKKDVRLGLLLMASALVIGGCGGGGGGTAVPLDKATATATTESNGATKAETKILLANATATIAQGTILTDVDGNPVTGSVSASVLYSDKNSDLDADAKILPAGTDFVAFLDIELKNFEGRTVKYLSNDMTVNVKVPGTQPGDTIVHYSFNGLSWIAEESATVKPDGTLDIKVTHFSLHAFFKHKNKDTTPPTVILLNPSAGETNIAGNTKILAVFSEPMNRSTIKNSTFTLKTQSGSAISGTVHYDAETNSAMFRPDAKLPPMTSFIATLTTGCKDLAGNSLKANVEWTFEKEWKLDETRPTVKSTDPPVDATYVAVDKKLTINFNEQMDPFTVKESLINDLPGCVRYDPVKNEASFTPKQPLSAGKKYCFTVRDKAKDLAGNILVPYTWCFTTFKPTGTTGSSGF